MKACFGHSEGAAGIHGALLAILAVQDVAAPPVMHSRSLNAYVMNAIADWKTSCNLTAIVPKVFICSVCGPCISIFSAAGNTKIVSLHQVRLASLR